MRACDVDLAVRSLSTRALTAGVLAHERLKERLVRRITVSITFTSRQNTEMFVFLLHNFILEHTTRHCPDVSIICPRRNIQRICIICREFLNDNFETSKVITSFVSLILNLIFQICDYSLKNISFLLLPHLFYTRLLNLGLFRTHFRRFT